MTPELIIAAGGALAAVIGAVISGVARIKGGSNRTIDRQQKRIGEQQDQIELSLRYIYRLRIVLAANGLTAPAIPRKLRELSGETDDLDDDSTDDEDTS